MANEARSRMSQPNIQAVNREQLNSASKVMILNDGRLVPSGGIKPKIWTCSWYNMVLRNQADKEKYCYKKGDAVWINTEDLDQFVQHNFFYIKNVVQNNGLLRNEYRKIEGDHSLELQFFKKVATGEIVGNQYGLPLYYFGNLLDKTKIKVSLENGNDDLPTDSSTKWKDFFKNQNIEEFQTQLNAFFDETLSSAMSQHLAEYHLSGITQYWIDKYGQSKKLEDFYLLKDLSNVDLYQEYSNTPGENDRGFDYVLYFFRKTYTNDSKVCKWFRVWRSGYLEHGGIVKNNSTVAGAMEDSLEYESKFYKVNLSWTRQGTARAPAYRCPINSNGFYMEASKIDVGNGIEMDIQSIGQNVDSSNRYNIQVTPIMSDSSKKPYQTQHPSNSGTGVFYLSKDIVSITNSSFCFFLDSDVQYYSYYTSGFASNVQQGFK